MKAKSTIKILIRSAARRLIALLLRIVPASKRVVVVGWPDTEGNSVEVLRHLINNYRGIIYWFISRPPSEVDWLISDLDGFERVVMVKKNGWKAFFAYISSELVFFTHGLYLSPEPSGNRVFVNLWHGDGPKRTENSAFKIEASSTFVVSGTELWGRYKARFFGVKDDRVLIVGNPRIDQFHRPASDQSLLRLGLNPGAPIVLWLPTFRQVRSGLGEKWCDGAILSAQDGIRAALRHLASAATLRSVQIVFKPHPMEADVYSNTGIRLISDAELESVKVPFYSFIARANCLITDYSSVWTDYLALDRPIAFFCPDLAEYKKARGFNVDDFEELLPGPILATRMDIDRLLDDVSTGRDNYMEQRARSKATIGAVMPPGSTQLLFEQLFAKQRLA